MQRKAGTHADKMIERNNDDEYQQTKEWTKCQIYRHFSAVNSMLHAVCCTDVFLLLLLRITFTYNENRYGLARPCRPNTN